MTSSGLLDLFGAAVAKEQPWVLEFISRLSPVMFSCACKTHCRRNRCLHTAHMTQIHTWNLCLIQRPSVNTASQSTNQTTSHTPSAKHPASRRPRQPANWPVGQRSGNCLSTFCQHFANMLPIFCQAAVSTQVHQCFCALNVG